MKAIIKGAALAALSIAATATQAHASLTEVDFQTLATISSGVDDAGRRERGRYARVSRRSAHQQVHYPPLELRCHNCRSNDRDSG